MFVFRAVSSLLFDDDSSPSSSSASSSSPSSSSYSISVPWEASTVPTFRSRSSASLSSSLSSTAAPATEATDSETANAFANVATETTTTTPPPAAAAGELDEHVSSEWMSADANTPLLSAAYNTPLYFTSSCSSPPRSTRSPSLQSTSSLPPSISSSSIASSSFSPPPSSPSSSSLPSSSSSTSPSFPSSASVSTQGKARETNATLTSPAPLPCTPPPSPTGAQITTTTTTTPATNSDDVTSAQVESDYDNDQRQHSVPASSLLFSPALRRHHPSPSLSSPSSSTSFASSTPLATKFRSPMYDDELEHKQSAPLFHHDYQRRENQGEINANKQVIDQEASDAGERVNEDEEEVQLKKLEPEESGECKSPPHTAVTEKFEFERQHTRSMFLVGLVSMMFLLCVGTLFYHLCEVWSLVDSLYFSVMTLTTTGLDLHHQPTSSISIYFTTIYLLVGLATFIATISYAVSLLIDRESVFISHDHTSSMKLSGPIAVFNRLTVPERKLLVTATLFVLLLCLSCSIYMYFDSLSFTNAIYLSVIVITTLGYGNVEPVSGTSRMYSCVSLLLSAILFTKLISDMLQLYLRSLSIMRSDAKISELDYLKYMLVSMKMCSQSDLNHITARFHQLHDCSCNTVDLKHLVSPQPKHIRIPTNTTHSCPRNE